MKKIYTISLILSLCACQDSVKEQSQPTPNPNESSPLPEIEDIEEEVEEVEEEVEEAPESDPQEENTEPEDPIEDFYLPDLLQCASQATNGQTIRMTMRNIYGQAYTEFTLGHLHETEMTDLEETFDQAIYQSLPTLGDDRIDIVLDPEHSESEGGFFGGEALLSVVQEAHGLFAGTLESPKFGSVGFYCWHVVQDEDVVLVPRDDKEFYYSQETGKCENDAGEEGYNLSSVVKVRETGDGECVNMEGWSLEEHNYSYPNLDWNVRGALMNGAQIHFANMIGADFRGANMSSFEYGYTFLQGLIDDFTFLPIDCEPLENEIDCMR